MKHHIISWEGSLNIGDETPYCVVTMDYSEDYLEVIKLQTASSKDEDLIEASEAMALQVQEEYWDFLKSYCQGHLIVMAEYFRDLREEEGDFRYHEKKDRAVC